MSKEEKMENNKMVQAGALTAVYWNGFLRYIRLGDTELVRMIYFALRDEHWGTLPLRIVEESVTSQADAFHINYTAESLLGAQAVVRWEVEIEGTSAEKITFSFNATFLTDFTRNRAGFCLLHPLQKTTGRPFQVVRPDQSLIEGRFPDLISPHQPCIDITRFSWSTSDGIQASITYSGDVFEMEDQRNWSDASFKTYCTPLALPFPVRMEAGAQIGQRIELEVSGKRSQGKARAAARPVTITCEFDQLHPLPEAGCCLPLPGADLQEEEEKLIRSLRLASIRADLPAANTGLWKASLDRILQAAKVLGKPLHLFIHPSAAPWKELVLYLQEKKGEELLYAISLTAADEDQIPFIRQYFPAVRIGLGTAHYFTQYNRNPPGMQRADHAIFSNNPQVHAFDEASITETIEGQAATVQTCKALAPGKAVWVSPISLRARFNRDAIGPSGREDGYPHPPDPRIAGLFVAGWTVGCLAALARSGAAHVDWYETHGPRGILQGSEATPVFLVLREVLKAEDAQVYHTATSDPLKISALGLRSAGKLQLLLVNHTEQEQTFHLPHAAGWQLIWSLHEDNAAGQLQARRLTPLQETQLPTKLPPYGCIALERSEH